MSSASGSAGVSEWRSGYRPLLGAIIGAGCGLSSISFYTHGAFVPAIADDTGWSRGELQLSVTIMILMAVVTAPAVGFLIDRFGPRKIALTSIVLYGAALASLSLAGDHILGYYIGWAVMSIVAAGTLPITWTRVVTAWFDRRRGIALGITLAGTGVAATLAPGFVIWLSAAFGWRTAYVILAATVTAISLPGVYLLFREPVATKTSEHATLPTMTPGLTLQAAMRQRRFWFMAIGLLLVAAGISGLITSLVPMLIDKGFEPAAAGRFAGLIGISVIGGRLITGFLLDRMWAPLVAAVFLSAPAFSAAILLQEQVSQTYLMLAVVIVGLAAGAELDLFAYLASKYFGLRHYGAIYGSLYVAFSIGAGIAPFAFGMVYDFNANYSIALSAVVAMSLVGGLMMLLLGRYPTDPTPASSDGDVILR
ncbi:MAG: MFS transporter [Woeseiaceae bacterium]